jgi:tRNA (guanine37-N1)-methyltransferase
VKIWVITLYPEFFTPFKNCGVVGQALSGERGSSKIEFHLVQLRDYALGNYKSVDDSPYGGGAGMIMRADILQRALLEGVVKSGGYESANDLTVVFPTPRGVVWNTKEAKKFTQEHLLEKKDLVFIAGRYEGVDERFIEKYVDLEFSIGDYVLSGGELAIMSLLDSSLRFVPGVLGNATSLSEESFEDYLLECPQYTKPSEFEGMKVPEILLSGHHEKIQAYKLAEKKRLTQLKRPDLWQKGNP